MEVKNAKGGTYPLALMFVMLIVLLLNAYCCGAAVIVKSNTTVHCNGRLDECLIEDDLELEFLINPYISRVLADAPSQYNPAADNSGNACQKFYINFTLDRNQPACKMIKCTEGCKKPSTYNRECRQVS
uniref:Uncharacterized protein n=1 Tax=Fagus sylvatica TaxID=28930 RepID=A0A2N9FIM5_FAGSY